MPPSTFEGGVLLMVPDFLLKSWSENQNSRYFSLRVILSFGVPAGSAPANVDQLDAELPGLPQRKGQ